MPIVHKLDYKPTLGQAQKLVGGYVEPIKTKQGLMLVDEDGLSKQLPPNQEASIIAGKPIVGDVILLVGRNRW